MQVVVIFDVPEDGGLADGQHRLYAIDEDVDSKDNC